MARGNYDRGALTEYEKNQSQRRLSHFLKDHRDRNKLKASDVAEKIGYAIPKYIDLESETRPHGRFVNSLDFLAAIANLDSKSIVAFVAYLFPSQSRADSKADEQCTWHQSVVEALYLDLRNQMSELGTSGPVGVGGE